MRHRNIGCCAFLFGVQIFSQVKIISISASAALAPTGCSPGWVFYENSCYKHYSATFTWSQAKHACEALESHLVTIGNAKENEFVYQTLAKGKTLWLGMYRNPVEFSWVTAERVSYKNWINGEAASVDEKCGEMTDYSEFHGKWNDNKCDLMKQGYICEQDLYVSGLFNIRQGVAMNGHVMSEYQSSTDAVDCILHCLQTVMCKSVNYFDGRSTKLCQLNNASYKEHPENLMEDDEADYYEKISD